MGALAADEWLAESPPLTTTIGSIGRGRGSSDVLSLAENGHYRSRAIVSQVTSSVVRKPNPSSGDLS
jgi:hypothetical protein